MNKEILEPIVRRAIEEDLANGKDITTDAIVPPGKTTQATFVARENGVVAGLYAAVLTFEFLGDGNVEFTQKKHDGEKIKPGDAIAEVRGSARTLLTGERTALNFLTHLSGIATLTRKYVNAIAGTSASIVNTRKTLPGLRALEKYAVTCGGGKNHRFGLFDAVLIKDNHLVVAGSIHAAVAAARTHAGDATPIELEVNTLDQLREALNEPINAILLDNMTPAQLTQAVRIVKDFEKNAPPRKHIVTEASGGISLETVRAIAESGVNRISVGRLTHSAPSLDIALDLSLL